MLTGVMPPMTPNSAMEPITGQPGTGEAMPMTSDALWMPFTNVEGLNTPEEPIDTLSAQVERQPRMLPIPKYAI